MIIAATLLAMLAAGGNPVAATGDTVAYAVAPLFEEQALAGLRVRLELEGDADGETRLQLPRAWAGSDELWRQVGDLQVEGATAVRAASPAERILTHPPGARLVVHYRVASAYAAEPGFAYEKARPLILSDWFFFHGEGVFATVEGRLDTPARFAWRDFPAGWKIASDLDHLAGARSGTVRAVVESVAIGAPDLTIIERERDGAPLRVAIRGSWNFAPQEFADAVERILVATNRLWGDRGRPFLVPVAPLGGSGPGLSYTGTARGDAFSVASTPGFELTQATRFLAHEYLHSWIPDELGGHLEDDEALGFWFSEGFTDFYAPRILLRADLWSPTDYIEELNRVLLRHATSPARAATAADILQRFWSDGEVQRLSYDRGHLLALLLDHQIREASAGRAELHAVLRAQRDRARRHQAEGRRVPAPLLFPSVLREETGLEVAPALTRHVDRGEQILLPADLFGGCATVVTRAQPEFDRGFDLEATNRASGILSGVDPAAPAYAAGLRDGMRIIRREGGVTGDSSIEIVYRVADGEGERVIRYLPRGRGQITLQRVQLAADRSGAECARRMSGAGESGAAR